LYVSLIRNKVPYQFLALKLQTNK